MKITAATQADILYVGQHMREADANEVFASGGQSPVAAVLQSARTTRDSGCRTLVVRDDNGVPLAVFGIAEVTPGNGTPWLLATPELVKYRRFILRVTREYIRRFSDRFPLMWNHVDARNATSIRWLKWAGFTIHPAKPFGIEGLPFHLFTKVTNV